MWYWWLPHIRPNQDIRSITRLQARFLCTEDIASALSAPTLMGRSQVLNANVSFRRYIRLGGR